MIAAYRPRLGRPVAGDVIPQPDPHPPLGRLDGDELLGLDHVDRVAAVHGHDQAAGAPASAAEHDARVDRLVELLATAREAAA